MKKIFTIILLTTLLFPVELVVDPYLQNATPISMHILWETDSNSISVVEWGMYVFLSESTTGSSFSNYGSSRIHTVELTNLEPNTQYYYRVVVGNYENYSDLYSFITPPEPSSEADFRIVAMSDMQKDYSNPNKFNEIIHDGVIDYLSEQYTDNLSEALAMVLVTGDLVDVGSIYSQWNSHFFEPGSDLFSRVPLYPVFGNHEQDTDYFIKYFHLPENGTPGYDEHWYYTDYSNLRVIGLDSNSGYRVQAQLDWLEEVLSDACSNNNIDFVFAQLHHPHKSELWLPGEIDYTGEVIELMENFTDQCEKPSIHFFGHTHGYSRGQSKDHNHLWVNVATAGGNIDYWGEYSQADYPEFTVTQDEWGFVLVDVQAGENPEFILRRISRGNENQFRDNELRDEIIIRLNNHIPSQPTGVSPQGQENPDMITLVASDFIDQDGDQPISVEWSVYEDCNLSIEPVINEFINMNNWYYNENTQESIELTETTLSMPLNSNSSYCFRVRYRDTSLGWSQWSETISFTTGESLYSENLLTNPGAELGTLGWIVTEGYMESLEEYVCDGVEPYHGDYYFIVGALCNTVTYSEAYQEIDLSEYSECINDGLASISYGGYLSDWGGQDHPEATIIFIDENGDEIEQGDIIGTYNSFWTLLSNQSPIPIGTNAVQMVLMGTRYAGDDNDSYFDDLFLRIFQDESCMGMLGDLNDDDIINILDVIILVNIILGQESTSTLADMNGDENINILDVIILVNTILNF